jgi:hypothetical protein
LRALPLAFGTGTGSELRSRLGITIVGGLLLSQLLTLYTTPVVYLMMDRLRLRALGRITTRFRQPRSKERRRNDEKEMTMLERKRPHPFALFAAARWPARAAGRLPRRAAIYHAPAPPAVTAPNYKESTVNFQDAGAGRWPARRTR